MANKEPLIISGNHEMRQWSRSARAQGKTIGLVPTMGYLHEGHLSLIEESKQHSDLTVVSIYVNPGQFSPNEDLSTYPSDFIGDVNKLKEIASGVDVVFHPKNLYDYGLTNKGNKMKTDDAEEGKVVSCVENSGMSHETAWVRVERLEKGLCGISRPVFFRGVATIVTKLFNIVEPDVVVFGKKDYQQFRIIQRMVRDLDFGINVIVQSSCATLMALQRAQCAPFSTRKGEAERGQLLCKELKDLVIRTIHEAGGKVDYAEIVDHESLEALEEIKSPAVFCVAVWFGDVRLVDNIEIDV